MPQSKLPMFRDFVPEWLRFPLLIVLPFIFQSSNPIWMSIVAQVMSDTVLRSEDVMMCGFASILGITVTFPILFRLKFRFTTRQILFIASSGIALCTLIATCFPYMPVLLPICFICGIFKVWGTFECMSSMMTIITPNMHLAPFLTIVFLAVFSGVELGGWASTKIAFFLPWQYVSYFTIALHLSILLFALLLLRDFRFQPPVPLKGIDWTSMALWGIFLMAFTAFFLYGDTLDWFHSASIRICCGLGLLSLGLVIWRMYSITNPFIERACFRYRNLWNILIIFFVSGIMLSTQNILQNILTGTVLGYSPNNSVALNWAVLAGIGIGCFMGKWGLCGLGWSYKQLTFLSLLFTTMYVAAMYFLVAPNVNLGAFVIPSIFNGIGHALVFVVLTTYVESNAPFEHRFQMLAILGLVRTGLATPMGNAFFAHLFKIEMSKNLSLLGSNIHPDAMVHYPYGAMVQGVVKQALMVSLRNLFGIAVLIGVATLLIILLSRFNAKQYIVLPSLRKIRQSITATP